MSQTHLVYPQSATGGLSLYRNGATLVQVHEDEGEYAPEAGDKSLELSRLSAAINDKLLKAEAVAWLLSEYTVDETITEAATLLAGLIEETREVHNELWGKLTDRT